LTKKDIRRFAEIRQKLAVVEKVIEPWFKELGFEEWKPQTECERLTGKSHEGHFWEKGPNHLLKLQNSS